MSNELLSHDKVPDAVLTVRIFPDGVEYDINGDTDRELGLDDCDRARTIGIIFKILIDLTRPK